MALSIKNGETNRLARELAAETGETLTAAVTTALRERLARLRHRKNRKVALDQIQQIAGSRKVIDPRAHEAIVAYDAAGLPNNGSYKAR